MRQLFYVAVLTITAIGHIAIIGTEARAAGPSLSDSQVMRVTGTVNMVHSQKGTVVIDDREYVLPSNTDSSKRATRNARVDFLYRESMPLPVITEILPRR